MPFNINVYSIIMYNLEPMYECHLYTIRNKPTWPVIASTVPHVYSFITMSVTSHMRQEQRKKETGRKNTSPSWQQHESSWELDAICGQALVNYPQIIIDGDTLGSPHLPSEVWSAVLTFCTGFCLSETGSHSTLVYLDDMATRIIDPTVWNCECSKSQQIG